MQKTFKSLSYTQALEELLANATAPATSLSIPLDSAGGRVLNEDLISTANVPNANNSAMDGYAICAAAGTSSIPPATYTVMGKTLAGDKCAPQLQPGHALRIFTGASIPPGTTAVAMQEECEEIFQNGIEFINVFSPLKEGSNIRLKGEDVKCGDKILSKGQQLRPQDIAALASSGRDQVSTFAPLKVALVSTGNELVRPPHPLKEGQIYDSNHYLLHALLSTLPVEIIDLGILPDDTLVTQKALEKAAEECDLVLSSGGAGQGEADLIGHVVQTLGSAQFWELAIKPGRPFMHGRIGNCDFLGLPGNPVAAMVSFLSFARPFILKRSGVEEVSPTAHRVPAAFNWSRKRTGRREFLRGRLSIQSNGQTQVEKYKNDGSALISSLTYASGLIIIDEQTSQIHEGDLIEFIPFSAYGF
ncbi:molybdopterin molybdotransferase MoeA [Flexibacterium corallicola]|uniref:molybdopterin molybdotransferase MoeA n=1 Tax=Flexibacterium corallicola TaxID=3037259 RepID=UPI00286F04B2|nr:gephyrin-like molybdotransferase Glp [Pseudovibrio sp. M1P-2-3]